MQAIVENAQTFPFCNDYRLILIKGMPEKVTDAEQKIFEQYIKNPVKQTVLVFVFDEKTPFFQKNFMSVTNVDCDKMTKPFLTKYVATLLNKNQKAITMDAVELLIDFCLFFVMIPFVKLISFTSLNCSVFRFFLDISKFNRYFIGIILIYFIKNFKFFTTFNNSLYFVCFI